MATEQILDQIAEACIDNGHSAISITWVNDGQGWFALITDRTIKEPVAQGRSLLSPTAALEKAYAELDN